MDNKHESTENRNVTKTKKKKQEKKKCVEYTLAHFKVFLLENISESRVSKTRLAKTGVSRGVRGHAPPDNFERLVLGNVISSILRSI